jgi:hypothetical protein
LRKPIEDWRANVEVAVLNIQSRALQHVAVDALRPLIRIVSDADEPIDAKAAEAKLYVGVIWIG